MTVKKKGLLRNAIIKALGGFTEDRIGPPDLPPSILPSVKALKFKRVIVAVTIEDAVEDRFALVSDLRMRVFLRERLAEELDNEGLIAYEKRCDESGERIEVSIYVGESEQT